MQNPSDYVSKILKHDLDAVETRLEEICRGLAVPEPLNEAIAYCLLGAGKRIRPVLFLEGFKLFSDMITGAALDFACAVECLHTYTLIHDDLPCMDNDDFRRGKPSCHKKFGQGIAVLCGDALLNLSYELILNVLQTDEFINAARYFSKAVGAQGLIGGQVKDICGSIADLEGLLDVFNDKTGKLITSAVYCGAMCGGADGRELKAIEDYGLHFGTAFQLYDDLSERGEPKPNTVKGYIGFEAASDLLKKHIEKAVCSLQNIDKNVRFLCEFAELFGVV